MNRLESSGSDYSMGMSFMGKGVNPSYTRTPDVIGSICFLASSWLALLEFCHGYWCLRLHNLSWWIVIVNLLGSIAFMVSAVFAIALRGSANLFDLWIVNLTTCIGAACFLIGAYLLLPEMTSHPQPDYS